MLLQCGLQPWLDNLVKLFGNLKKREKMIINKPIIEPNGILHTNGNKTDYLDMHLFQDIQLDSERLDIDLLFDFVRGEKVVA